MYVCMRVCMRVVCVYVCVYVCMYVCNSLHLFCYFKMTGNRVLILPIFAD